MADLRELLDEFAQEMVPDDDVFDVSDRTLGGTLSTLRYFHDLKLIVVQDSRRE